MSAPDNYFKVSGTSAAEGVFPFDSNSVESMGRAWRDAYSFFAGDYEKPIGVTSVLCVWRKTSAPGPWSNLPIVGEDYSPVWN